MFLGVVAGLLAGHLPGYSQTPAVAALSGAACVSVLRLPLTAVTIASLLSIHAGLAVTPLIILAVVAAYITSEGLTAYVDARVAPGKTQDRLPPPGPEAQMTAVPAP